MTEPKITIHAAPGMSEEQIVRVTASRIDERNRRDRLVDRTLMSFAGGLAIAWLVALGAVTILWFTTH